MTALSDTVRNELSTIPPALGRDDDGGSSAAARLELLALLADLSNDYGTVTLCAVMFRLPGRAAVQHTWSTSYRGMIDWLMEQTERARTRYGITTLTELLKPSSPIKVAIGRIMPEGNFVTDGNWAAAMNSLPASLNVFMQAQVQVNGQPGDFESLEMYTTL